MDEEKKRGAQASASKIQHEEKQTRIRKILAVI